MRGPCRVCARLPLFVPGSRVPNAANDCGWIVIEPFLCIICRAPETKHCMRGSRPPAAIRFAPDAFPRIRGARCASAAAHDVISNKLLRNDLCNNFVYDFHGNVGASARPRVPATRIWFSTEPRALGLSSWLYFANYSPHGTCHPRAREAHGCRRARRAHARALNDVRAPAGGSSALSG